MITAATLDAKLGQEITAVCPTGYTDRAHNHCAHFVSHMLEYTFGFTCGHMVRGTGARANIRVHELFARCPRVGRWADRPATLMRCLVFITNANNVNVATKQMTNVPRKHVGIFIDGSIWHYSNTRDQVVKQTPAQFERHYPAPDNAMFFGEMP